MAKQKKSQIKNNRSVVNFNDMVKKMRRDVILVPKSLNQEKYILSLLDKSKDIIVAYGPAGTGKTFLAMQAAIKNLQNGVCERIILTRPAVEVEEEKHGYLPGTLEEKMTPWTKPLLDVMRDYYAPPEITKMLDNQTVEIAPLAFMRGRSFRNSWIIGDEMQNASPAQMKMLLTRIGEGSKIIITGDIEQTDKKRNDNGLLDLCEKLNKDPEGFAKCKLDLDDIQRHRIIETVLELYS